MLIRPWDAPLADAEWQEFLRTHPFGQLVVNGPAGEPPSAQPLHFAFDAETGHVVSHLARPNPIWPLLAARPEVLLSVVDDYTFIPGPWQAAPEQPPEHGVPTSFYAAVQLHCLARVVDDPEEKAELLGRHVAAFQPPGTSAPVSATEGPFHRQLPGIRALALEVVGVRAKFKYGGKREEAVQERIAGRLAERDAPGDAAARAHQLRRLAARHGA
ncbi:FMN-binding negative transcriptional regulator [Streptomyces sp. NPDC059740]|uniref:FMN-binding negative transcriptional regulator n=1 Tax=Streptomyces sp. NPDC059740 TaxID=3346926 RepID=UPI003657A1A5